MNKYQFLILLGCFLTAKISTAQKIKGFIYEAQNNKSPIPGANVYWKNTTIGTFSDENGNFEIANPNKFPSTLVVSFIGYQTDSIIVNTPSQSKLNIKLSKDVKLEEFELTEREASTKIDLVNPLLVETLNKNEFTKAACCNISESFETNASVDVNFTDAVSGTKKIQMLGLDGIYTQIQAENLPMIRGLSSAFGLTFVPGTWAESIQIKKGAGSVVNGYESITGQINVELLKPDEAEQLFVNVYGNEKGRAELNIHGAQKLNEKWSTMTLAHVSNQSLQWDKNEDTFLDMPLKTQFNFFNRWKYRGKKHMLQFGVKGVYEDMEAGQIPTTETNRLYKIGVLTKQFEVFTKNGFLFPEKPYKSIGIINSFKYHNHESKYGDKEFNAEQMSGYLNAIYQTRIVNENHTIKVGSSLVYDHYDKNYNDSLFGREEIVPGIFTEYALTTDKSALVLGVRGDYHNLYGAFFTPRAHYKYNFTPLSALRFSVGRGFRTANPYIENASVMASSRRVISEKLAPEIAWNYGTSVTHKFEIGGKEMSINLDYYFTDFQNQVVVDLENPDEVSFYNLQGKSYSHSFQAEVGAQITQQLEIKAAYKLYDIKTDYQSGLKEKPLVPRNRALVNIGYITNFDKWKFDLTGQWFDVSRLPSTATNMVENRISTASKSFVTLNGQITRAFKRIEFYAGVENITNFKQDAPIIAANDPFGSDFDASLIWGSVNGRVAYGGLRFKIQ
ncbi:MAG: TonB-dependent receptor [Flavobacteriales bacterium]|nr:TonB-dependent receptor [Flavobacteriales bacterium]MCB9365345.1 TonB-dependent receptor [Flavobacteriales bacterium]